MYLDLSARWCLPAYWYAPEDQLNFKIFLFASTRVEKLRETIETALNRREVEAEQISVKVEAGVGVPLIEACQSVLDDLLPGVPASFEFGYTHQILQELIYHIHWSNTYYMNLWN